MIQDSVNSVSLQEGFLLHDHYKILSVLGRGGFSFTYKAHDKNLDRFVAIKEYFPSSIAFRSGITVAPIDLNSKETYVEGLNSFIKEGQTLAKFRNEHICTILDYFQDNGTAYLIMPYLAGESLEMVLKKCPNGAMNPDAVRKWLLPPLLDALQEIHKSSYIHRDIKPSNIYITYEGQPILIDFGAARASIGRTHGYTVVLTPKYAPPEQLTTNIESQGPWTDIYALAAVVFRCLIGYPPPDAQARILAKANGTADPLESELPNVKAVADEGLYNFIEKSLVLSYTSRLQSVNDAIDILNCSRTECVQKINTKSKSLSEIVCNTNFFLIVCSICFAFYMIYMLYDLKSNVRKTYPEQNIAKEYHTYTDNEIYQIVLKNHEEGIKNYNNDMFELAGSNFAKCISYKNVKNSRLFSEKQATCANYLAIMYSEGKGSLQKNDYQALNLFKYAADLGNRSAKYNLAKRYLRGIGTEKNIQKAIYWYKQAADEGDIDAANALGYIFENGIQNIPVQLYLALKWYEYAYSLDRNNRIARNAIKRLNRR